MMTPIHALIASEWPLWSNQQPQRVRPLDGGLTNQSFLLQAGTDTLVLRINAANSEALDLNRAAEAEALATASNAGLCAPLVYLDPHYRYLVTRFIDGTPPDTHRPDTPARLARFLHQLHQLPPTAARLDYAAKAAHYWQSIDTEAPFAADLIQLRDRMQRQLHPGSVVTEAYCLCHNDLLPGNLLEEKSGQLRAIDWEYAASGDPFFDLATVTVEFGWDRQQQQVLLAEYLQRPATDTDFQRLRHWLRIYRYLSVLWYAVQQSQGNTSSIRADTMASEINALRSELAQV